jgi:hypothetical protein
MLGPSEKKDGKGQEKNRSGQVRRKRKATHMSESVVEEF